MHPSAHAALAAVLAAGAALTACRSGVSYDSTLVPMGLETFAPYPEDNAPTRERVELGRRLFFDRVLSADGTVSCSSCHRPEQSFADAVSISPGVYGRLGRRNTPSLLNVAYARHLTWDGRSRTLEEQVLKPIQDPVEMALSLDTLVARISAAPAYRTAFRRAYGEPASADGVSRALASYVRSLRSGDAPVDRFHRGQGDALSPEERAGFRLFVGKARCSLCHWGATFSDGEFHNTGVAARSRSDDDGRYARTGANADLRAFRTASLRHVARTAPYMHDGSIRTLEEVVDFYNDGGGPDAGRDVLLRPLGLSAEEKRNLVAFLRSLSGT